MRSLSRKMAAAAAVMALAPALASATIVTFSTTGAFNIIAGPGGTTGTPATPTVGGVANSRLIFDASNYIQFVGASFNGDIDGISDVNFGSFQLVGVLPTETFSNVGFTITVSQTAPTVGGTSFVGRITGTLSSNNGTLNLTLTGPTSMLIGNVIYTMPTPQPSTALVGINGTAALAPLPAPVAVGMAAMGLVGWARRKRKGAPAA